MSVLDKRPLPTVEDLRDEINEILTANKRVGQGEVQMIMESASTLKKLCSFIKMKCRRKEVSSVTHPQIRRIFRDFHNSFKIYVHTVSQQSSFELLKLPSHLSNPKPPEEEDFQFLCLALDPMLQVRPM